MGCFYCVQRASVSADIIGSVKDLNVDFKSRVTEGFSSLILQRDKDPLNTASKVYICC